MKLKDVILMNPSIQKLAKATNLPLKVMYGAGKAIKQIQDYIEIYNKKNQELFNTMGETTMVPDPDDPKKKIKNIQGNKNILPGNLDEFNQKINALQEEEVADLYKFEVNLSDLKSNYVFLKELHEKFSETVDKFLGELRMFEKTPSDEIMRSKLEVARVDMTKIVSAIKDKTESLKNDANFTVLDIGNLMPWIVDDSEPKK